MKASPLDPTIRALDMVDLLIIGAALICGWQVGEWWGVGLAGALVAEDWIAAIRNDIYRTELLQGLTKLATRVRT